MTANILENNLLVLQRWSEAAAEDGLATPHPDRLVAISRDPQRWRGDTLDSIELFWAETIDHLLDQVRLGVVVDVALDHLPSALRAPGNAPRADTTSHDTGTAEPPPVVEKPVDRETQLFDVAYAWRTEQIAAGAEGIDEVKDVTLRNLARRNYTSEDQIRMKLPRPAKGLAASLAAAFAELSPAPGGSPDSAVPQPPAPPVAPAHSTPTADPPASTPGPTASESRPPGAGARPVPVPAPVDPGALDLGSADFCEYEYPEPAVEPGRITAKATGDGVQLSWDPWPAQPGETVIYRVISSDSDQAPYKPDMGDSVSVTTSTFADDTRFLTAAVRVYQVWCHIGHDLDSARMNQPELWANGEEVSPVDGLSLTEEEGRVIGRWTVYPGTNAVRVFRIPLDGGGPPPSDPRNQICTSQPNLTGFVDTEAPRGRRYLYRAVAEVSVGGTLRLSRPKQVDVLVPVQLVPIDDLVVEMSEGRDTFDIRWTTTESGQNVRIYRFESPPPAGLESEDRDESAITVQGFDDASLIKEPISAYDQTTSQIAGVLWPQGWERAYVTPVTVSNGRVRIGTTRVLTRPLPAVVEPRIIERFQTQVVTFGWPAGAAVVNAYIGFGTATPEQITEAPHPDAEISAAAHRRDGGLTFARPLPHKGCTVCLVPVAFSRAELIRGEITALSYPGVDRVRYWFERINAADSTSSRVRLVLSVDADVENPPALVLVNNEQRLPLEPRDGRYVQLDTRSESAPHCVLQRIPRGEFRTEWTFDPAVINGYIRLFVYNDEGRPRPFALQDPPLGYLKILPATQPPGPAG